jgi:hypothetical protein
MLKNTALGYTYKIIDPLTKMSKFVRQKNLGLFLPKKAYLTNVKRIGGPRM